MIPSKKTKQNAKPKGKSKKPKASGANTVNVGIPVQVSIIIPIEVECNSELSGDDRVGMWELVQGEEHTELIQKTLSIANDDGDAILALEALLYIAKGFQRKSDKNVDILYTPCAGVIPPQNL